MKTTRKEILKAADFFHATNINECTQARLDEVRPYCVEIAYSAGIYGINACLWQDERNGDYYFTPSKNSNYYRFC